MELLSEPRVAVAVPAVCQGHICKGSGKVSAAREAHKKRTLGKRRQTNLDCNNNMRNQNARWHLHLKMNRTFRRSFRKTVELKTEK
jgi:hypothetical protein